MYSDENSYNECCRIANDIMFKLIQSGEEFMVDDFARVARSYKMYPYLIKKFAAIAQG